MFYPVNDQILSRLEADLLHSQYQALLEVSEAIASRRVMKSHVLETPDPTYTCPPGDCPMESPGGWVRETQQPWVASNPSKDSRFPDLAQWLCDRGVRSLCVVPVTTALRKLGALAFGSTHGDAYSESDVRFLQQVARQVAVALDNALNFEQAETVQQQIKEERDRLSLLLEVNNTIVS